jgi:hypothetical protein
LECAFGVVGKILMSRIQWNLFSKIWIQNVGDIDFKVISAGENSKKFQKTRFWKKKSEMEDVGILGPTAQATLVNLVYAQPNCIYPHQTSTLKPLEKPQAGVASGDSLTTLHFAFEGLRLKTLH